MHLYGVPSDRGFHAFDIRSEALITISLFNKFTSVFLCVITVSKWLWNYKSQASRSVVNFDNVITKFI